MHKISKRSVILASCVVAAAAALQLTTVTATAQSQPAKRVYIVQSYEKGHVCGEPQAEGILDALAAGGWKVGTNLTVQSYYMDTYRTNAAPEAMKSEGQKALAEIAEFKPDIVFVLDDAAVRQVMLPLIGRTDLSVVFSGMNGQPEIYNDPKPYLDSRTRPGGNVTGVYEKLYASQSLKVMAQAVPALRGGKAVMITDGSPTGNGLTKQFEIELKDSDLKWEVRRVKDWGEYTALIQTLNDDATVTAIYPVAATTSAISTKGWRGRQPTTRCRSPLNSRSRRSSQNTSKPSARFCASRFSASTTRTRGSSPFPAIPASGTGSGS